MHWVAHVLMSVPPLMHVYTQFATPMQFAFATAMSCAPPVPAMSPLPPMSPLLLELPQLAVMNPPTAATAKAKNICRIRASGKCYNDAPFILCVADHVK